MTAIKTRKHGTDKQVGKKFPVVESGGKAKIFNIHHKEVEEFDNVKVVKTSNNRLRITAEDEDGNPVSQFISIV